MVDILVDLAYGDSGKGRIVDYLANNYTSIGRWGGSANAGHTLIVNNNKLVLHQLPSGVLHPEVRLYMGAQMVIDPVALIQEIEDLEKSGIHIYNRLFIAHSAHVVTQDHKSRDIQREEGNSPFGSTRKGVAPCYSDKAAKIGVRMESLRDDARYYKLWKCIYNNVPELMAAEPKVLLEGAQGFGLDLDHGDYPYVTSSNTTAASACVSFGVSPKMVDKIFGVTKAYTTRVGLGPFVSELFGTEAEHLREKGKEYGATTGRPRRCGWLDTDMLYKASKINGVTDLVITKLDVLTGLNKVGLYTGNGMEYLDGWNENISGCDKLTDLPENAQQLLMHIGASSEAKMRYVSVGPDRSQIITVSPM